MPDHNHRWLWVPAFAGTTPVNVALSYLTAASAGPVAANPALLA
jgi:hypothetical protein